VFQQPTRRIEAKFSIDQRSSTDGQSHYAPAPPAPCTLSTPEDNPVSSPTSPSSSGHYTSLTDHAITSSRDPATSRGVTPPEPLSVGSSTASAAPQDEVARRMHDLLTQIESHVVAPISHTEDDGVQPQRQVEILRHESEELRLTGSQAPPAYI